MLTDMATRGRPRANDIDAGIRRAVVELVSARGFNAVTIEDVVRVAGTNKPAFYRRFSGLAEAVATLLTERYGTDEDVDTGSFAGDLLEIQRRQATMFRDEFVVGALGSGLERLRTAPEVAQPFVDRYLAPRRRFTHVLLARAVERDELDPGTDADWVADVLTGPLLMRALMPGLPPIDDELVDRSVAVTLDSIGYRGDRSMLTAR
ncbi:TetR/AcrR family transcriptional regulator [Pseudoclavibacter chungangensis]|uniref:TetR/AcrR family transcriptional regulator n=2 Tax=Pseudoclavibacter chungangensis TaxID=587635 RepID=A0A7J5BNM8_9MICO|nr:TetR/AcrR family transcriptional regulator [Pseudoclavibacter chungangensis]